MESPQSNTCTKLARRNFPGRFRPKTTSNPLQRTQTQNGEVSRKRLRVCLPLEVKPGEKVERPKGFKSEPSSPYAVLTFRRPKPK